MLLPGRYLFGGADVYRWFFGIRSPAHEIFAFARLAVVDGAPGTVQLRVQHKAGYPPSRENLLVLKGSPDRVRHGVRGRRRLASR